MTVKTFKTFSAIQKIHFSQCVQRQNWRAFHPPVAYLPSWCLSSYVFSHVFAKSKLDHTFVNKTSSSKLLICSTSAQHPSPCIVLLFLPCHASSFFPPSSLFLYSLHHVFLLDCIHHFILLSFPIQCSHPLHLALSNSVLLKVEIMRLTLGRLAMISRDEALPHW